MAIAAVPNSEPFTARIIGGLLPTLLLVGFFWWMGRRAMNQQQSIFGAGKSQARRYNKEDRPPVTFADVAGADAAKGQLQEVVTILKAPEPYRQLGARIPRGLLRVGPPAPARPCWPAPSLARRGCPSSPSAARSSWKCSSAWARAG